MFTLAKAASLLVIGLATCQPQRPYRTDISTARRSFSGRSDMTLIPEDSVLRPHGGFSVVSSMDVFSDSLTDTKPDSTGYSVLLIPNSLVTQSGGRMDDLLIGHSANLRRTDVLHLIDGLDTVIAGWSIEEGEMTARVYRFRIDLQNPVPLIKDIAIKAWIPYVEYNYNRTTAGSYGILYLGDDSYGDDFDLDLDQTKNFRNQLVRAVEDLRKKGMK